MAAVAIVVFREVLEAALIVGLLAAATRSLAGRWRWMAAGIGAGCAGAVMVAAVASRLAASASGIGQELFNAAVLLLAVAMLGWHTVWMSRHARELSAGARRIGAAVAQGSRRPWVLGAVIALAVLREGAEVVLFLYGIAGGGGIGRLDMASGGALGIGAGVATGALLYGGLAKLPVRELFRFTNFLLVLLAAGLAAQAASLLAQSGILPELRPHMWNTASLLSERGVVGQVLHTLVGYRERPSGIEVLAYVLTAGSLMMLGALANRPARAAGEAAAASAAVAVALLLLLPAKDVAAIEFKVYPPYVVQGEAEIEARGLFISDDDVNVDGDRAMVYELGYSPGARWHTSVFVEQEQQHEPPDDDDLRWEAVAWENIFQLTEPGEHWLDLGAYFEYEKGLAQDNEHGLEAKLLAQKNIGRWVVTANPIFAIGIGDVDNHEVEFEYACATRYRLRPEFEPGFEAFGGIGAIEEGSTLADQEHVIGPDVRGVFRVGPGKLVYNVGYLFGMTDASPDGAVKFELEYEFRF